MKHVIGLLLKASITMALVACAGQSSDPVKDYKDVKFVPKNNIKPEIQQVDMPLFRIAVNGTTETSYGNFVVNKQGKVTIQVVSISDSTPIQDSEISISEFDGANQPRKQKIDKNTHTLTWTPDASALNREDFVLSVKAKINGRTSLQSEDLVFTVSRDVKDPTIEEVKGLKNLSAKEGNKYQFSVVVKDPNYEGEGKPQVFFPPEAYSNLEAYKASAHKLVDLNPKLKPTHLGGGIFQYFYVLDLQKLPEDMDRKGQVNPNSDQVELCLNVGVASVAGRNSGIEQQCLFAKYEVQPAKIELLSSNRKVKGGATASIDMKISAGNAGGLIEKNPVISINGKPVAAKDISCPTLGEASVQCTLSWTPACDSKGTNSTAAVLIKASSTLNGSSKDGAQTQRFEVTCADEKAAATAEASKEAKEKNKDATAPTKQDIKLKKATLPKAENIAIEVPKKQKFNLNIEQSKPEAKDAAAPKKDAAQAKDSKASAKAENKS